MNKLRISGVAALAVVAAVSGLSEAQAQTLISQVSPKVSAPASDNNIGAGGQDLAAMPDDDMMPGGMMGCGATRPTMMGGMMSVPLSRHMMKLMFAIVDANGDGALSFEEVTAVHKRVFDIVDADRDNKVTLTEIQSFWGQ